MNITFDFTGQVANVTGAGSGMGLDTTSLAIHPDRNDLYVVSSDGAGGQGATAFHAQAFSKRLPPALSQ